MPCDANTLLDQVKCLQCNLTGDLFPAAEIALLCSYRDGTPLSCDSQALLAQANCIRSCIPLGMMGAVKLGILCSIRAAQSPQNMGSLVNWWRADTLMSTVADGGKIGAAGQTWNDSIGGVVASQASAADRPTLRFNGINGQPAVDFLATFPNSNGLNVPLFTFDGDFTVIAVIKATITSGVVSGFRMFLNSANQSRLDFAQNASFIYSTRVKSATSVVQTLTFSGTHLAETAHIVWFTRAGSVLTAGYQNTQQQTVTNTGVFSADVAGQNLVGGGDSVSIRMAELMRYSRALSLNEILALYNLYFKPRYRLT